MLRFIIDRQRNISVLNVSLFGKLIDKVDVNSTSVAVRCKGDPAEEVLLKFGCEINSKSVTVQSSQLGDFLHIRAPVLSSPDDGVLYAEVLLRTPAAQIRTLYCRKCQTSFSSRPFVKSFTMPSKNWRDLSDLWVCESEQFQAFERNELCGVPGRCLVGTTFVLVDVSDLELDKLVLEGPCGDWRTVECAVCRINVGIALVDHSIGLCSFVACVVYDRSWLIGGFVCAVCRIASIALFAPAVSLSAFIHG
jgi:hypothetical protein